MTLRFSRNPRALRTGLSTKPRYFGHRVFEELAGRETWTSLMALSLFGRRLSPELCGVLDDTVGVLTLRALHTEIAGAEGEPTRVREVLAQYRKQHRFVWGFGTPNRGRDERVIAFRACMERRARTHLPYYRTMTAVAAAMKETSHQSPRALALDEPPLCESA